MQDEQIKALQTIADKCRADTHAIDDAKRRLQTLADAMQALTPIIHTLGTVDTQGVEAVQNRIRHVSKLDIDQVNTCLRSVAETVKDGDAIKTK